MKCSTALDLNILLLVVTTIAGGSASFVQRFEYLQYRPAAAAAAGRTERAAPTVSLNFTALGREFRLLLTADQTTLGPGLVVLGPGLDVGPPAPSHLQLYQGAVLGEPGSFVFGSLRDGVFTGTIEIPPVSYYVEPPQVLAANQSRSTASAHSVIYSSRDVKLPGGIGCGFKDHSTVDDNHLKEHVKALEADEEDERQPGPESEPEPEQEPEQEQPAGRSRRFISSRFNAPPATNPNRQQAGVCTMAVETDPILWKYVLDMFEGDMRRSRDYLISLIGTHMVYVNHLYAAETFNGVYQHEGLQFQLQKLLITDEKSCAADFAGEPSRFCPENVDYKDYLNLQSRGDHREFCLAFAFTYRTFTENVMGYAWKGSSDVKDRFSGVCGQSGVRMAEQDGKMVKVRLSKNCGIVSLLSHDERVPPIMSHLTFAHEIGHSLGSPHDLPENNKPECLPGGFSGNYIMYPFSVSGYDPNNSRFSPCSVRHMARVLDIIANGQRRQCFLATTASYCGNGVRESGEECDCGFTAESCTDSCCYPRLLSQADMNLNRSAAGCARRAGTECSTSEGPCCQPDTCRLVPASVARTCHEATDCQLAAVCNGSSAACPAAIHRPNYTECQRGSKICLSGLCQASVCLKTGLEECGLTSNDTEDPMSLCGVSCRQPGPPPDLKPCSLLTPDAPVRQSPGTSCDAAHGYCDVFGRCRPYRELGPLATVHRLLFTREGRTDLLSWLQYKWWAAVLLAVSGVLLMALTVRCCAVHTPSSNPRLPPARQLRQTARRPVSALGLPRPDQVKCWLAGRAAAAASPEAGQPSASAPSAPTANDADAWSETSSFEHVSQLELPGGPTDGGPAPMASVAV